MKEFKSILKDEMGNYISLCQSEGKSIVSIQSGIRNFDSYLSNAGYVSKNLTADIMKKWVSQLKPLKKPTISWNVIVVRQFLHFLSTLGIDVFVPEIPVYRSDYVPYAFSDIEIAKIFENADTLPYERKDRKESIIQFSVYLRILYGCGLRSGEAIKLRKSDIDFNTNILTIRCAKGKKDRIVPMSGSLAALLESYTQKLEGAGSDGYLFARRNGLPRNVKWAYTLFRKVLKHSGIVYLKEKHERSGPSPYSMRHSFVHRAYRKYAEAAGHAFEDIIPFLSAYLGHENADGTDRYFRYGNGLFTDDNEKMDRFIAELLPEVTT